jgi:hypothetical protein
MSTSQVSCSSDAPAAPFAVGIFRIEQRLPQLSLLFLFLLKAVCGCSQASSSEPNA